MSLGPRLSHQLYGSDKHKTMYMSEAFSSQGYDPNCFVSSPYEELLHPLSLSMDHLFQSRASPSQASDIPFDSYQTNFDVECSTCPNQETSEYNEDSMRLKLQELERALLDDDDAVVSLDHLGMELEVEWTSPIGCLMLQNSPKESSSLDSNLSSISGNKQVTLLPPLPRTAKQLLFDGATAISEGNLERAAAVINELRQTVSIQGNPSQRLAAYMVEGLAARLAASGKILYKALKCKEPPSSDRLAAMQILFEVCPCFKFGFMAANGVIMEAFRNEKKAHIIDFDINQGSQYISLIQSLAKQPGKLPQIRLTGVDDPESVQHPVGGLNVIGQRLEKLAEALDVPFKFQSVPANVSAVTPAMLGCWAGKEAIIVNFAFQLHHMPDESVSTVNERDRLLRLVKGLNPKVVTLVEQDMNTNTTPFLPRFAEAYSYYSAVFESLDATLPRESQDRLNVEKQCLARDIVNIVACEGEERIERYEAAGKWRARMMMAGFSCSPMNEDVSSMIRQQIRQYCDRYTLKEEMGVLHFGWEEKNLVFASAWR